MSLLRRAGVGVAFAFRVVARTPVVAVTAAAAAAVATLAAFSETATVAFVAFAIAVGLAHHGRGAFLQRVDANGEKAQHVLVDALLPLDLRDGGGGCIDVEEREMRLAVFAHAERQGFHAPVFGL